MCRESFPSNWGLTPLESGLVESKMNFENLIGFTKKKVGHGYVNNHILTDNNYIKTYVNIRTVFDDNIFLVLKLC